MRHGTGSGSKSDRRTIPETVGKVMPLGTDPVTGQCRYLISDVTAMAISSRSPGPRSFSGHLATETQTGAWGPGVSAQAEGCSCYFLLCRFSLRQRWTLIQTDRHWLWPPSLLQLPAGSPSLASLTPVPQKQVCFFFWFTALLPQGLEAEDAHPLQEPTLRRHWLQQLPPHGRAPTLQTDCSSCFSVFTCLFP